jgi:hypothetical protein
MGGRARISPPPLWVREGDGEIREGLLFAALREGHAKRRQLHCPGGAESFMEPPGSASMAVDGMAWAAL